MTTKTTTTNDPTAGAELAQGTPGEPAAPTVGDLVVNEDGSRYGLYLAAGVVLWLGEPAPYELPIRKAD
jgi:hypothetical protein